MYGLAIAAAVFVVFVFPVKAYFCQLISPGSGTCGCCKMPGLETGLIYAQTQMGCFPLCESCWLKLETPEQRLPYYRQLFDKWDRGEETWKGMKASVLEGK